MTHAHQVGAATVTAMEIDTGTRTAADLEQTVLADPAELAECMEKEYGGFISWSFAPVIIATANRLILVDTGFGFTSGEGRTLATLLAAAEVPPQSITDIVITHGHGDHVSGLVEDDRPTFPGTRVVYSRQEYDFHVGQSGLNRRVFELYETELDLVDLPSGPAGGPIEPGPVIAEDGDVRIRALPLPGHTPGHMGLEVASGEESLWLLADTSHFVVQLSRPEWSPRFDIDPNMGARTRRRAFETAAESGILVQAYHYPFPGFGHIRRAADGFAWVPV